MFMALMTMANLLFKAGLNWEKMAIGEFMDVTEKNIKIRSFNHDTRTNEFRRINHLVYKGIQPILNVASEDGNIILRAAKDHPIWDDSIDDYVPLCEIDSGVALSVNGEKIPFVVTDSGESLPVADMSVEGNLNYFSNGLLSHNSGGQALKFFTAVRMVVRAGERIEDKHEGQIGMISKVKTIKNKVAPPFRSCDMKIIFGKGYQVEEEYVQAFVKYGIIKKAGGWYTVAITKIGEEETPEKVQGEEKVLDWLKGHPEIYSEYKNRLMVELSRKTTAVIVEDTEDQESSIVADQEKLEQEVLAEEDLSPENLAKAALS
jgi:hypothetical protein